MKLVVTGRGAAMSLPKVVQKVAQLSPSTSSPGGVTTPPHVLYLGTPTYDDEEKYEIQTRGLRDFGCSFHKLDVSEIPDDKKDEEKTSYPTKEEISNLLHKADVIMVSGGNTKYAVERWVEFGIDEMIRQVVAQRQEQGNPPVLCGGSAGAICWFASGHSDSMDPRTFLNVNPNLTKEETLDWKYIRVPGINILPKPAFCVPHYDAMQHNGLLRSEDSDQMILRDKIVDLPCIGIDEEAAFVMNGHHVSVVSASSSGEVDGAKCYWKMLNSETQELEVKALLESKGDYLASDLGLC